MAAEAPGASTRRAAALAGVVVFVACFTGFVTGLALIVPLAATVLVIGVAALDLVSRRRFGALPHGTWFLLLGSLLFWTSVGWASRLDDAIVVSSFRCGTPQAMALVFLPPMAAFFAGGIAGVVLLMARYAPDLPVQLARFTTITCNVVALVLAPFVLARTLTYPTADRYVESLPLAARFDAAGEGDFRCETEDELPRAGDAVPVSASTVAGPRQRCVADTPLGPVHAEDIRLRRVCTADGCAAHLLLEPDQGLESSHRGSAERFAPDQPLEVRRDVSNHIVVLSGGEGTRQHALSRITGMPVDVSPRHVASKIAPPVSVTIAALGAVFMALCGATSVLVRRLRARRYLAAPEATVDADGWLVLDGVADARPVRVDGVRPGRVIVLGVRRGEPYRDAGSARVIPTSHEEVRAEVRLHRKNVASLLAIVLPAAVAPVVMAALLGLVL